MSSNVIEMPVRELARKVLVGEPGVVLRFDSVGRNRYVRWQVSDGRGEMWSVYRDGRLLGVVVRHEDVGDGWVGVVAGGRCVVEGRPSRYEAGKFLASYAGLATEPGPDDGDAA